MISKSKKDYKITTNLNHINSKQLGRIRNTPEPADELDDDSCVLSLGLFPGELLEVPGDDR